MPRTLSTVDTTKTTTASSSKTTTPRRNPRIRAQQPVFRIAAAHWSAMNGEQRNSYAALVGIMADSLAPTMPARHNGYSTFVALSAANLATNQPLHPTAPPYAPAPPLPCIQVTASYDNNALTLTLATDTAYPHPIAIKAAKPSYAASSLCKSTQFKQIGSLPSLTQTADITALYLAPFRVPGTGYKIALELTGVSPGGYQTPALLVIAIVTSPAAKVLLADPQTPQAALKIG